MRNGTFRAIGEGRLEGADAGEREQKGVMMDIGESDRRRAAVVVGGGGGGSMIVQSLAPLSLLPQQRIEPSSAAGGLSFASCVH